MRSNRFIDFYKGAFTKPGKTFNRLIKSSHTLRHATIAVTITATLYTFVYVFLILGGGQPFSPWLDIPLETYYRYNVFFCAPSMFLGWVLATGVVHLLMRVRTSSGSFEQTAGVFGFGIGIASWSTGIHDILTSFLGAIHVINQRDYEVALNSPTIWRFLLWLQMGLYLVWFIFLFSKGVKYVYRVNVLKSYLVGTVGFIVYQSFFFIFNR